MLSAVYHYYYLPGFVVGVCLFALYGFMGAHQLPFIGLRGE
jgi:hypothetical protein